MTTIELCEEYERHGYSKQTVYAMRRLNKPKYEAVAKNGLGAYLSEWEKIKSECEKIYFELAETRSLKKFWKQYLTDEFISDGVLSTFFNRRVFAVRERVPDLVNLKHGLKVIEAYKNFKQ